MKRLVLVDGNALLHRAYHATPPLSTSKGELVNAVYGFSNMLLKSWDDLKPDFIAIAWDKAAPTFRHQAYTQYKATRGPSDDALSSQYDRVHEVVDALNIPEFSLDGFEADDLIGTLARQAVEKSSKGRPASGWNLEVIVLTGDRDIMQIIGKRVKVLMPRKTLNDVGLYGEGEFFMKYGFEPKLMVDYKALAGDASDNIPGVPGIGDVSATKLIKQFGTVEKIYQPKNLKTLPERMQTLLSEGAESAALSKKLATLELNAPIKLDLAKCRVHDYDQQKAITLFSELEFKSLVTRLTGSAKDPLKGDTHVIPDRNNPNVIPDRIAERESSSMSKALVDTIDSGSNTSGMTKEQTARNDSGKARNDNGAQNQDTIDLDLAVTPVLEKMTKAGVLIDLKFLEDLGVNLKGKLKDLEKGIYDSVGHEFNINSPKQLSEILFDELHLPVVRKTKTGRSTDEGTLSELSAAHPMIPLLLQYRQLFKLVSTYVDALPKSIAEDGRIHSTFNVEGAATGRLSSQNPNLQNIPVRGQTGGDIRKAFIASKGKVLLGADYSQVELRILAHVSGDENLIKAFKEGLDIHIATASKVFNVPLDKVSKEQRLIGKTMNFATLYGQGPRALSKQLGIEYALAKEYISEYFEQFPRVKNWMAGILEKGIKDGYVETMWGRKRYIPELQASNKFLQAFGQRAAVNHPIQGTSADMIKKAMVEIDKQLMAHSKWQMEKSKKTISHKPSATCQLILQVHDELLFECTPKGVEEIAKLVKQKMENALKLSVPVKVDLKTGPNWGEMTPLKLN